MKSHYKTVCEAADITAPALMLPHCSQCVFPVLLLPEWGVSWTTTHPPAACLPPCAEISELLLLLREGMKVLCADNALHFVYSLQEPTTPLHVHPSTEQD